MKSETYHYNITSRDDKPLSERTKLSKLRVKTYQDIHQKREIIFWYKREDVPNPEEIINPGIRMNFKSVEEVAPNMFVLVGKDGREFGLELLYVE